MSETMQDHEKEIDMENKLIEHARANGGKLTVVHPDTGHTITYHLVEDEESKWGKSRLIKKGISK